MENLIEIANLTESNIEAQMYEMWEAVERIPEDDEGKELAVAQAQAAEAKLKKRLALKRLIESKSVQLVDALASHELPPLYRISWLSTLLKVVRKPEVMNEIIKASDNDADAVSIMLEELTKMQEAVNPIMNEIRRVYES